MKKLILTSMLAIAGMQMIGQPKTATNPFKISYGDPYEFPKKYADYGFYGDLADGFVQLCYKYGDDIQMLKFDNHLRSSKNYAFDLSKMPKSTMPEKTLQVGEKYYWMYSSWEKDEKKEHLTAKEIDIKNCTFTNHDISLIETDKLHGTPVSLGMYHIEIADKYDFYSSADKKLLLITYLKERKEKDDSKNHDIIGLNLFDDNLKKLWSKEIQMPYTEEMMTIHDYYLDEDGNAYILARVYEGSRKKQKNKDDIPNYHYEVLKVSDKGNTVTPIKINVENNFINQIYIYKSNKNDIVVAGYYSHDIKGSSDGLFMVKIDENNHVTKVSHGTYEMPREVLTMYMTEKALGKLEKKEEKGDDVEVGSLVMRRLQFNSDGSIIAIGEQYWVTTTTYYSNGRSTTTYHYHYGAIYVMKIGADGNMAWAKKIPKNQTGDVIMGTMGFSEFQFDDGLYFFYMDNLKNLNLQPVMDVAKHLDGVGGILMFTKIDENGTATKGKIFDAKVEDVRCMPQYFEKMDDNILVGRVIGDHKQSKILKLEK